MSGQHTNRQSRARGCLMGQLCGDALGSHVEFMRADDIAAKYPGGHRELLSGGPFGTTAGQPTDDSEMALSLTRAIVAAGGFDREAVSAAYVRWWRSNPPDIGFTTSAALSGIAKGRAASSDSQANGALMRVSPVGILAAGDPLAAAAFAREDASLTHPADVCLAASPAFAAAIAAGIETGDRDTMVAAAMLAASDTPGGGPVVDRLTRSANAKPPEYYHQMGWVLTAFQNAFFELQTRDPLEECLVRTVAAGGDTDTNGAIVGALLGAADGIEAIPERWQSTVLTCRSRRPKEYWATDLLELADALLAPSADGQDASRH